jgi:hypothetical protein
MDPLHDYKCGRCDDYTEHRGTPKVCPRCGADGRHIRLVFRSAPALGAKHYDPYDALDRVIPDSKPIKSFANDRRKGGKLR